MNYTWEKIKYKGLKTTNKEYSIELDTYLMWPYGHLYGKILKGKEIIVDFRFDYINFKLYLTPGDYTSQNSKSLNIDKDDYFQIAIKVNAYTSYEFQKELYDDILYIRNYISNHPDYTIDEFVSSK